MYENGANYITRIFIICTKMKCIFGLYLSFGVPKTKKKNRQRTRNPQKRPKHKPEQIHTHTQTHNQNTQMTIK
jgi:hypothetical protein